ncbi:MAG: glycosyltransferase [bacterium]
MNNTNKKILIIGSVNTDISYLKAFLFDIHKKGISLIYWGDNETLLELFKSNNWSFEKMHFFKVNKFFTTTKWLMQLFYLLKLNKKLKIIMSLQNISTLIISNNAKLFISSMIIKRGLKLNWLEIPTETATSVLSLKKISKKANLITFSSIDRNNLKKAGYGGHFKTIEPGLDLKNLKRQDSIFQGLARLDHPKRKFFTIGTITPLNNHRLEILFKAIARAQEVIPNIHLVIVGGGPEKKTLMWLAKRMGIESSVWLVGEQANKRKWLENLDLYLSINQEITIDDLFFTLEAMAAKLPIIANFGSGLDDLVFEGKNGYLTCMNDSEVIAQYIINIEQDAKLKERLGQASLDRVTKHFNLEQMSIQFEKII